MKKYSIYKPSGIEWIGDVPEHWKLSKNKIVLIERKDEVGQKWEDYPLLSLTQRGVILRDVEGGKGKFSSSNEKFKIIEPNNLIFCLYDIQETPRTVGLSSYSGMITGSYNVYETKSNPKFIYYWYLTIDDFKGLKPYYTGLRNVVRSVTFNSLKIFLPPSIEQLQIVQFLDQKTEIIDKLISTKERKIDLLKEQRTSLINEVITKGLDPNVKMKDSGVEWIGEIPEHWDMRRVSNFGTFFKGSGIKKDEVKETGIPCIRYGEIYTKYDRVVYEPVSFIDEETSMNSVKIKKGDVLFTGSGETMEDIGKSIVYFGERDVFVGGDIIVLRLYNGLNPLYISYLMNTSFVQYQKSLSGRGEIIVHIYSKNIKEIKTPLPPLEDQENIVEYLDNRTKEIDDLVSMEKKKIGLLKEYRQSLITEVITGKIDVRTNLN